jgi:hypothetical protein
MAEKVKKEMLDLISGKSGRKILSLFLKEDRIKVEEKEIYDRVMKQGRSGWDVKAVLQDMCESGLMTKITRHPTIYVLNLDAIKIVKSYMIEITWKISEFIANQEKICE